MRGAGRGGEGSVSKMKSQEKQRRSGVSTGGGRGGERGDIALAGQKQGEREKKTLKNAEVMS